jgi:cell division protein FtsI (penicillin-binding protein 3)
MKRRVALFVLFMAVWTGTLAARLYRIQIAEHEEYRSRAQGQHYAEVALTPPRGTIFDRAGRRLAVSAEVDSVYTPGKLPDTATAAGSIADILGSDPDELARRLSSGSWTWIARQVEPSIAQSLRDLELGGVHFVKESKRFYPLESVAGPLLGFVGTDHNGLAGLEAAYDEVVSGKTIDRTMLRDALQGQAVAPGMSFLDAEPGEDLHLTIDAGVQYIVERELTRAMNEHSAKAASAVFMNPHTGEIYAMASLPSFDPNRFGESPRERWRNRVIQDAYEPGSTMKMVTAVAALEANALDPMDVLDCEMGSITLGSTRIRDHKPFGLLTFRDVIAKSSNVGAIKAGVLVGAQPLARQIEAFGFGDLTGIDLPGESRGIVRSVDRWTRHEIAYASIGHGLSVTPIQLVRAFAAVANGGRLVRPYVVEAVGSRSVRPHPREEQPILSRATNRTLLRLLEAVVEEGTGQAAVVGGYRVAGKTGTAQKVVSGGYAADLHVASFAGFVPSRRPRIVGVVVIDEPRGRFHGGEVAAPVFSAILNQVLPLLGVAPEERALPERLPTTTLASVARSESAVARSVADDNDPVAARTVAVEGVLPSFAGLSARQALQLATDLGVGVEFLGSGFVSEQVPLAGAPIETVSDVVLRLEMGRSG